MSILLPVVIVATGLAIAYGEGMVPNGRKKGRRRRSRGSGSASLTMVQPMWKSKSRHVRQAKYPTHKAASADAARAVSLYKRFGAKKVGKKVMKKEDGGFFWYAYGNLPPEKYQTFHRKLTSMGNSYFNAIKIDS